MSNEPVVLARDIKKLFRVGFLRRPVEAVRGVSFDVFRNEVLGIIGPNGAGKTTTLKILTGLIRPDGGTAEILGASVGDIRARRRIGYLPEGPYFYEHLRAPELLRFYGQLLGVEHRVLTRRIDELLELVGLQHVRERPIRKFSKGMRQRVGLAQALLNDPELVILDEPQSGLDPIGRREVRELIATLKSQGKTVMFSSHILPDVEAVCDRVVALNQGLVVHHGPIASFTGSAVSTWEVIVRELDSTSFTNPRLLSAESRGGATILRFSGEIEIEAAVASLIANGARLVSVRPDRLALEDVFDTKTQAENST